MTGPSIVPYRANMYAIITIVSPGDRSHVVVVVFARHSNRSARSLSRCARVSSAVQNLEEETNRGTSTATDSTLMPRPPACAPLAHYLARIELIAFQFVAYHRFLLLLLRDKLCGDTFNFRLALLLMFCHRAPIRYRRHSMNLNFKRAATLS